MLAHSSLYRLRKEIDRIDRAILAKFNARAHVIRRIAEAKRRTGVPVHDPGRETRILARLSAVNRGPLDLPALKDLFGAVIAGFRRFEKRALSNR